LACSQPLLTSISRVTDVAHPLQSACRINHATAADDQIVLLARQIRRQQKQAGR
jgi:hypothetical protein